MIEDKLLRGYAYRNSELSKGGDKNFININTGVGGAKMMVDTYREKGLPDSIIENLIEVHTDEYGWQPLSKVNVKKLNND